MSFAVDDFSEDMRITEADRESTSNESYSTDYQTLLMLSTEDMMKQKYIKFAAIKAGDQ